MNQPHSLATAISRRFMTVFLLTTIASVVAAIAFSYLYRSYRTYYTSTMPATVAASDLLEATLQIDISAQRMAQTTSDLMREAIRNDIDVSSERARAALQQLRDLKLESDKINEIDSKSQLLIASIDTVQELAIERVGLEKYAGDIAARLNEISRSEILTRTLPPDPDLIEFRAKVGKQIRLLLSQVTEDDREVINRESAAFRREVQTMDALLLSLSDPSATALADLHAELTYLGIGARDTFRVRLDYLELLQKVDEAANLHRFYANQVSTQIDDFEQALIADGAVKLSDLAREMFRFYWLLLLPPIAVLLVGFDTFRYVRRTVINSILSLESTMRRNVEGRESGIEITSPLLEVRSMEKSAKIFIDRRNEAEQGLIDAQRDLESALARAEAGEQSKSEFLARMSHELRSPLQSIMGYARLVHDRSEPDSKLKAYGRSIESSGARLLTQIEEILHFSKLDSDPKEVALAPCRIAALIEETVETVRLKAQQAGLPLELKLDPDIPETVVTNGELIIQIISNLLTNAVKYTERGKVTLTVEHRDDQLIFVVQDTGVGISAADRERMFLPFVQLERKSNKAEGVGLGLAIVQSAVQRLHGSIGVDETPGGGTTFFVSIPCHDDRQAPGPESVDPHANDGGAQAVDTASANNQAATKTEGGGAGVAHVQNARSREDARRASSQADNAALSSQNGLERHEPVSTNHAGSKFRILVVDDEPALAELQQEILEMNGYEVTVAFSGEEGLDKFFSAPDSFSGLITDNRMPGMAGVELIGKVLELRPNLAVILISGETSVIGNQFFIRPNFKHLQKPVNLGELIDELGRMMVPVR